MARKSATKMKTFLDTEEHKIAVDTIVYLEKKHGGDTMRFKRYSVKEVSEAIGKSEKQILKSLKPLLTEGLVRREGEYILYRTPDMTVYRDPMGYFDPFDKKWQKARGL